MPRNLAKTGFIASNAAITALAKEYVDGVQTSENVRGTYLRVLVAHSQRELADSKQLGALEAVQAAHGKIYPVVLQAVTTEDVAPLENSTPEETRRRTRERNRRSTFARTSKVALLRWIEAGGKLQQLVPADVTKDKLAVISTAEPPPLRTQAIALATRLDTILRDLAQSDVTAARAVLAEVEKKLEAAVPVLRRGRRPANRIPSGTRGELRMTAHH